VFSINIEYHRQANFVTNSTQNLAINVIGQNKEQDNARVPPLVSNQIGYRYACTARAVLTSLV